MAKPSKSKPKKPWPSFPLFWHANGQWAKKIRGKHHYFGADAAAAHDEYIRVAADLHEGRIPDRRRGGGPPTVKELVNRFLNDQIENLKGDRIHANWFDESARVAADFAEQVGKDRPWDDLTPYDFGQYRSYLYDRWSPPTIRRRMTIVRQVFTHAVENEVIPRPARYGNCFDNALWQRAHAAGQ